MGYHKRFDQLIFDEDEKGCGTIKLKNGLDCKSFWAKYPPVNKDPKNSDKEISVYDTNNLGPVVIDHLTKGVISKYLECRERSPGTKENILDALQCLWGYAENKLKCFGDKPPAVNPTQNIEILKDAGLIEVIKIEESRGGVTKYYGTSTKLLAFTTPLDFEKKYSSVTNVFRQN